jgi:hypothetical protein
MSASPIRAAGPLCHRASICRQQPRRCPRMLARARVGPSGGRPPPARPGAPDVLPKAIGVARASGGARARVPPRRGSQPGQKNGRSMSGSGPPGPLTEASSRSGEGEPAVSRDLPGPPAARPPGHSRRGGGRRALPGTDAGAAQARALIPGQRRRRQGVARERVLEPDPERPVARVVRQGVGQRAAPRPRRLVGLRGPRGVLRGCAGGGATVRGLGAWRAHAADICASSNAVPGRRAGSARTPRRTPGMPVVRGRCCPGRARRLPVAPVRPGDAPARCWASSGPPAGPSGAAASPSAISSAWKARERALDFGERLELGVDLGAPRLELPPRGGERCRLLERRAYLRA